VVVEVSVSISVNLRTGNWIRSLSDVHKDFSQGKNPPGGLIVWVTVIVPGVPVVIIKVVVEEAEVTVAVATMIFVLVVLAMHVGTGIGNFGEQKLTTGG
jgi:hypothetical protein